MTDRTKTICPPIFDLGGIKMNVWYIHTVWTFNYSYNKNRTILYFINLISARENFAVSGPTCTSLVEIGPVFLEKILK